MKLILASTSAIRRELLSNAGMVFDSMAAEIDEAALKQANAGLAPGALASVLAGAKALSISTRYQDAMVIGADQILNLQGRALGKPADLEDAASQLRSMRGRSHTLETAVSCAAAGRIVWHHLARPSLTVRDFGDGFLADYLARSGEAVLSSAGAYQLELSGVQLFEAIDGDYFAILGLPLLPLLAFLRSRELAGS